MAKKLYPEENIQAIASAIRAKNGSSETYTIGEMAQAIEDIPSGDGVFKAGTIGATFNGYKDIAEVNVPDGVKSIGNNAFDGCKDLASVNLPDSLTSIGTSAFNNCSSLTSIDIPNRVMRIEQLTFNGCNKLVSIDLPDNLTSIGQYAFNVCSSLTSIDLPDSLTSIENNAFNGCSRLTSITCQATTPPTIQSNTFQNVPADAAIYVPAESVEAYKTKQYWLTRADYIQAIPSEG